MKSVGEKNSILVMMIVLLSRVTASGEWSGHRFEVMKRVFVRGWKTPAWWKNRWRESSMRICKVGVGPRIERKASLYMRKGFACGIAGEIMAADLA